MKNLMSEKVCRNFWTAKGKWMEENLNKSLFSCMNYGQSYQRWIEIKKTWNKWQLNGTSLAQKWFLESLSILEKFKTF